MAANVPVVVELRCESASDIAFASLQVETARLSTELQRTRRRVRELEHALGAILR